VFHDSDKVTSLFIHLYPPLTFTVIRYVSTAISTQVLCDSLSHSNRHFYPGAEERFPALLEVPYMSPLYAISLSGFICEYPLSHRMCLVSDHESARSDLANAVLEVRPRRPEEED